MKYPRVLIVSNNPLSNENNMGKTLTQFFKGFPRENLAQIYFHSGLPTVNICNNYYSFSDKDAIKSIIFRQNKGIHLENQNFENNKTNTYTKGVYRIGKKKSPVIYILRDLIWRLSNAKNEDIITWIKEFKPDVIFFASGDYAFSYRLAISYAKKTDTPLVTMCFDDYYLNCDYRDKFLGRFYYSIFMRTVLKVVSFSKQVIACNELMAKDYSDFFKKTFAVLFTPSAGYSTLVDYEEKKGISYIGGLGLNRYVSLADIGASIHSIHSQKIGDVVNIYSAEDRPEVLNFISNEKTLNFIGRANYLEVPQIISNSLAVVHTESFSEGIMGRTRLSLSTKISESLASGTVIIAYGSKSLASIDYLNRNNAAIVADNVDELRLKIKDVLLNKKKYDEIRSNAITLAKKNHSYEAVNSKLLRILFDAIKSDNGRCIEPT